MDFEKRLNLFVRMSQELQNCSFTKSSTFQNTWLNIKGKRVVSGFELIISYPQPDKELFKSYLMTLRQFISPSEEIQLQKVIAIIKASEECPLLRDCASLVEEEHKMYCEATVFPMFINDTQIGADRIRRLFFYGGYFHPDLDKIEYLEAIDGCPEKALLSYLFLVLARNMYLPVTHLATAIESRHDRAALQEWKTWLGNNTIDQSPNAQVTST